MAEKLNIMCTLKGFGLGLRPQHYADILSGASGADWFEIISENFMIDGGRPIANLLAVRERFPIVMHGVSLSIGSTEALDRSYLRQLGNLAAQLEPLWISDHFCWTGVAGLNTHDLLPLPYTEEALDLVSERVEEVQSVLGRPIALENASTYIRFAESVIPEWEFNIAVARRTGCKLLVDVNNAYVNAINHGNDAMEFLDRMPADLIAYVHLAGHEHNGTYIIDTHDHAVAEPVWMLYRHLIARTGLLPTMIERDDKIPSFAELVRELDRARAVAMAALSNADAPAA